MLAQHISLASDGLSRRQRRALHHARHLDFHAAIRMAADMAARRT